jgi:hypothetical protein
MRARSEILQHHWAKRCHPRNHRATNAGDSVTEERLTDREVYRSWAALIDGTRLRPHRDSGAGVRAFREALSAARVVYREWRQRNQGEVHWL